MNSILVSPLQVRCQHRRQYRPHQVSQLRPGNDVTFMYISPISFVTLFISTKR